MMMRHTWSHQGSHTAPHSLHATTWQPLQAWQHALQTCHKCFVLMYCGATRMPCPCFWEPIGKQCKLPWMVTSGIGSDLCRIPSCQAEAEHRMGCQTCIHLHHPHIF